MMAPTWHYYSPEDSAPKFYIKHYAITIASFFKDIDFNVSLLYRKGSHSRVHPKTHLYGRDVMALQGRMVA
jgi:hypothetical protein